MFGLRGDRAPRLRRRQLGADARLSQQHHEMALVLRLGSASGVPGIKGCSALSKRLAPGARCYNAPQLTTPGGAAGPFAPRFHQRPALLE